MELYLERVCMLSLFRLQQISNVLKELKLERVCMMFNFNSGGSKLKPGKSFDTECFFVSGDSQPSLETGTSEFGSIEPVQMKAGDSFRGSKAGLVQRLETKKALKLTHH